MTILTNNLGTTKNPDKMSKMGNNDPNDFMIEIFHLHEKSISQKFPVIPHFHASWRYF